MPLRAKAGVHGLPPRPDDPHDVADVEADRDDRRQDVDVLDDEEEHLSAHLHHSASDRGAWAVPVLTPDLELHRLAVDLHHAPAASIRPARDVDPPIAHLEGLQRASIAEPVGDQLAEERRLEQAVQDHTRQAHALRERLVVVDLVEIALSARVLHELSRRRMLHELRDLLTDLDVHRRIAVPRSFATVRPCWFTYSVSKMMKSRLPLPPVFS